MSHSHHNYAQE